ncbi:MAG: agmatine deiminase family protein [Bacteroidetes bacterium]|nr:agmatine deiminase family protein [Bacteroidota bacterium]
MRLRLNCAFILTVILTSTGVFAQKAPLPNGHAPGEKDLFLEPRQERSSVNVITEPPTFDVRTMAEWEEIQSLMITWSGFSSILKQITSAARQECEVIIVAENPSSVQSYLTSNNAGGSAFADLENVTILQDNYNSIWSRDYGAHTIYRDDVEEMMLVDWIYNRNRPDDNLVPVGIAEYFDVPLYSTTEAPWDLMATGGNFMSDGLGTAFSSELILEENEGGFAWSGTFYPDHSEVEIDNIMSEFMGIHTYIKMETLPYDGIHHIDMHMKLMDEETLLMGEYPTGVADGPQIEANLEYVLSNYSSAFGTPYKVIRVQMPPEGNAYPNTNGAYRTYTNMVFVNKTVIIPTYQALYDTPALAIIQDALPGYNLVPIQCNDIIELSGAIHCITKAIGVDDPLLIVHNDLEDTDDDLNPYPLEAMVKHTSGVSSAVLNYRLDGGDFTSLAMQLTDAEENIWSADIPAQAVGSQIDYYIDATANNGKQLSRPIVAPEGFWTFNVTGAPTSLEELNSEVLGSVYPNPARAITAIPFSLPSAAQVSIELQDMLGRTIQILEQGSFIAGENKVFFDAADFAQGAYLISLSSGQQVYTTKLMIQ